MAERIKIENKEAYSKLIISRQKQVTLVFACLITIVAFTVYIFTNLALKHHWMAFTPPILGFGALFIIYPPTEDWEYKPWQNTSEKREQTFFN
jgi:hypothetical protein